MKLKKNFLHIDPYLPVLSTRRIITGALLGLFFAFLFYNFLYLGWETCRLLLFFSEDYPILILPDNIVWRHHLFLAFLSLILGQSVCFLHWFDRPVGGIRFGRVKNKTRLVVHDQRYLNSFFLSWFARMAFVFCFLVGDFQMYVYYEPTVFGQYDYVFILIIGVLFLQTWITLRGVFQRSGLWMLISTVVITVFAFGFSCFHPIDYHAINEIASKGNLWSAYEIRLPESDWADRMDSYGNRRATMMVAREHGSEKGSFPVVYVDLNVRNEIWGYHRIGLDTLTVAAKRWEEKEKDWGVFGTYALYIDRHISMKDVNHLRRQLAEAGVRRLNYGVVPEERMYKEEAYRILGIISGMPSYGRDISFWQEIELPVIEQQFRIEYLKSGHLKINGEYVSLGDLNEELELFMDKHPSYMILFDMDEDLFFENYIWILGRIWKTVRERRDRYALMHYQKKYELLASEEMTEVRNKFPLNFLELTEEGKSILQYRNK